MVVLAYLWLIISLAFCPILDRLSKANHTVLYLATVFVAALSIL
jgi:hypothetical protein